MEHAAGSPGIVSVTHFKQASNKKFGDYVKYIDRDDATRVKYFNKWNFVERDGYNEYMGNPEKSTGLFASFSDHLGKDERHKVALEFGKAQKAGSNMWQTVVSFDNPFLEKYGLYNSKTDVLDEEKIRAATRIAMEEMLKREGMSSSALWTAAIHRNTDNIHVHIATVEPVPSRPLQPFNDPDTHEKYWARRGSFKPSTFSAFKSKFANQILERDQELAKISTLIRDRMPPDTKLWRAAPTVQMNLLYQEIYKKLPRNKQLWRYNDNAMKEFRPEIDRLTSIYMEKYKPVELAEFRKAVAEEVEVRRDVYGTGQEGKELGRYEDYADNKFHELQARMGNSVLGDMRNFDAELKAKYHDKTPGKFDERLAEGGSPLHQTLGRMGGLKRLLATDMKNMRLAKQQHKRMEREAEQEQEALEANTETKQNQQQGLERG
ncbi:MobP2 family relaxase [Lacticaseibacillus sharpeae]|uniref:Relaxase n=1 Tax=Lacticaseibacillus sharpeae JCM 1186 = DSM 20505 TaxID=1291052 RepID=A0A0R1ZQF6_9LACO|nr:MobP2 family relaxase [Lacticaseibacillus sharpeae]KRM56666.1 hypothetical protein FC18_GL001799 [Lacticaseibacillus sharpeae JCM 1186 = DSM 20505]